MSQKVFIRSFAETSSEDATKLAERLRNRLEALPAQVQILSIQPYWKIDGYQEICLDVYLLGKDAQSFTAIIQQLGTGWLHQSPDEAIWNAGDGATFVESSVRWAHVELGKTGS